MKQDAIPEEIDEFVKRELALHSVHNVFDSTRDLIHKQFRDGGL